MPFRIAAALLGLFFLGHTVGGMFMQSSSGPAADAVFKAMKSVHFDAFGSDSTWYGFWFGFGLLFSAFQLFSIVTCWTLASVEPRDWRVVAPISWALCATYVVAAILSWLYFFAAPAIFSVLVALLLAVGALRKRAAYP